jgi:hypothetical protein
LDSIPGLSASWIVTLCSDTVTHAHRTHVRVINVQILSQGQPQRWGVAARELGGEQLAHVELESFGHLHWHERCRVVAGTSTRLTHLRTHTHARTNTHTRTYTHTRTHVYAQSTHMLAHAHNRARARTHTHTHTSAAALCRSIEHSVASLAHKARQHMPLSTNILTTTAILLGSVRLFVCLFSFLVR